MRGLSVRQNVLPEHYLRVRELKERIEILMSKSDGHYEATAYGKVLALIDGMTED
jgi:hypothetical protein